MPATLFAKHIVRKIFFEDWAMKLVALAITLGLWLVVTGLSTAKKERFSGVPLTFRVSNDAEITSAPVQAVNVVLSGDSRKIEKVRQSDLAISVDLSDPAIKPGDLIVTLTPDSVGIELPVGVKLEEIQPSRIPVRLEAVEEKRSPSGRADTLRHMIEWLTDDAGGGGLVVKGQPGSGKSAVLARLATLADPRERAVATEAGALKGIPKKELPPLGVVDVAVHARAKDAAKIALEIAATLELELSGFVANPEAATATALAARAGRTVIVVDALDEAVSPANCAAFLRALLQKAPRLRVLVGLRESGKKSGWLTALPRPVSPR